MKVEKVAVLGASDKEERYSYKAFKLLLEYGHSVSLVSPRLKEVEGHPVQASLEGLSGIDTLTMYVNPKVSSEMEEEIIRLAPKRVIFNPGSENPELLKALQEKSIKTEEACTLILLREDQF